MIMASTADVETDAEGDALLHPDPSLTKLQFLMSDNNNVKASLSTTEDLQTGNSIYSNKIRASSEYSEYIPFMPKKLQNDYFDILIICAPSDEENAEDFKLFLERLGCSVEILEIGRPEKTEEAYQMAMFFFLYVTKEFCKCETALFQSHVFLSETLNDPNKIKSVVPVLTTMDKHEINLHMNFRYLPEIKYFKKDKDVDCIRWFLTRKARENSQRKLNLHLERTQYFELNKSELMNLKAFSKVPMKGDEKESKNVCSSSSNFSYDNPNLNLQHNSIQSTLINAITTESGTHDDIDDKNNFHSINDPNANKGHEINDLHGVQLNSKPCVGLLCSDVEIDGPASKSIKSPTLMTPSSSSTSSHSIQPNAVTVREVIQTERSGKPETPIHYHNDERLEQINNFQIRNGGIISARKVHADNDSANIEVPDVLKFNGETMMNPLGHNSGWISHRSKPNLTDLNPNLEKKFIGIFWDAQNCPVPRNKSATDFIKLLREKFISEDPKSEEKCFFCVTDVTLEDKKIMQAITGCGVDIIHISSDKNNASDFKIIQKMDDFSRDLGVACGKVILITSDIDYGIKMADLKKRGHRIILIHKKTIKPELLLSVDENHNYEELFKELPDKHEIFSENDPILIIHGYKPLSGENAKNFKKKLESSFSSWNGKVVNQRGTKFGILKFESLELAESAKEARNGANLFEENDQITVCCLEEASEEIRRIVDKILKPGKSKSGDKNQSFDKSLTPSNSGNVPETQDMGSNQ